MMRYELVNLDFLLIFNPDYSKPIIPLINEETGILQIIVASIITARERLNDNK